MLPEAFFHALSDETRLRCVALLHQYGELCVCELTYALGLAQPKISRHLAILRATNVLQDRRAGVWIHYKLHEKLPIWAKNVLFETLCALETQQPYQQDRQNLCDMPNRPTIASLCCTDKKIT
ncbi:metalloregulator ArsR/SmtB family transcription factor [Beggiatoa leptomitoformis]|uniref:Metalloregulator ArsR/SmtB family transcription factor n=1 Tax=Beggiatoa leptomitoformis TaxID=288004 RepID=A0A2N9YG45_9GAMM|nr:metalloregulator ArsR/SmtB family transcription factor [Beggiatoa leptomitoformis]ALG68240.1 metalloregulator ArsR/SmtB family transcription factor [Beggiatoa leptomitoformis]AUI69453.1 metalloregulator ArsR/SmtB family transcription factor [Beggiatoa leptomitoformis]